MNERIQELVKQAGLTLVPNSKPIIYQGPIPELEKFAELIVKEMYDFMCKATDNDGAWPSSKEVKQHFGVKE